MKDAYKTILNKLFEAIISAAISYIIAGGGTAVITTFETRLPTVLYSTLLWLVWLIAILTLVGLLLRYVFDGVYKPLFAWYKRRQEVKANTKLVNAWNLHWKALYGLLDSVRENKWKSTEEQDAQYFLLHQWFMANRISFIPLWRRFAQYRTGAAHEEKTTSPYELAYKVFKENYNDPYSYFYSPLTLTMLISFFGNRTDELDYVAFQLVDHNEEMLTWMQKL